VTGFLATFAAGLGLIVGSFLNVVIHRLPRREPLGMTRSKCPRCGQLIAWFDNVPLLSWIVLRGRCRSCRAPISLRYPLVEALTGALFVLAFLRAVELDWQPLWLGSLVGSLMAAALVAASFIDWDHKILPDAITLRALPVICVIGAVGVPAINGATVFGVDLMQWGVKPGFASLVSGLAGMAAGVISVGAIRWVGTRLARREAMGLGDVKLMGACGLLLGPGAILLALLVALLVGSVLGILIWAVTRNREIPFGPFLAGGVLAVLFFEHPLLVLVLETYPGWARSLFG